LPSASRRDPDDRNASVQKINDWFGGLRRGSENNFVARQKYCRAAGSHATFTRQVKLANASVGKPRAGWEFQALAKHRSHGLLDSRVRGKRHGVSSRTYRFPDLFKQRAADPTHRARKRLAGKLARFLFFRKMILKLLQPTNSPYSPCRALGQCQSHEAVFCCSATRISLKLSSRRSHQSARRSSSSTSPRPFVHSIRPSFRPRLPALRSRVRFCRAAADASDWRE
jgi:hypothetical protein